MATVAVSALALATFRNLVRRPGTALGALATAALLAILPRLGSPAASAPDNASLALELALTTLAWVLVLGSGAAGVQAASAESDGGAAPELLATPTGVGTYVAGRVVGIVAVGAVVLLGVGSVTAGAWAVQGLLPEQAAMTSLGLALLGTLMTVPVFAAFGMLFGAWAPRPLAFLLVVVAALATRTVAVGLAEAGPIARAAAEVLPNAARLDLARETAFGRPVSAASAFLAAAGAVFHAGAACVLAAHRITRREGA